MTAAGELDGRTWQQDIDWEGQFIPLIFLQQSLDCVGVRFAGAMHASTGATVPKNINNTVTTEKHRRMVKLYPTDLSTASDADHIFKKASPGALVNNRSNICERLTAKVTWKLRGKKFGATRYK